MQTLGHILLFAGLIVGLIGHLKFLVAAWRESLGWFLGCLLLPLIGLVFLIVHFRVAARPVAISLAGLLLASLGAWLANAPVQ